MDKSLIKVTRKHLTERRERLEYEINKINHELQHLSNLEKPFHVVVYPVHHVPKTYKFDDEDKARDKFYEMSNKTYYNNKRIDGVCLKLYNENKTFETIDKWKRF